MKKLKDLFEMLKKNVLFSFRQLKHLKTSEAELAALRGLTNEQRYSIAYLTEQLEDMKEKLDEASTQLDEATQKIHRMAVRFAS